MDEADLADKEVQRHINSALAKHMNRANQATVHYKDCCWCGDSTENGARFCCKDCAEDFEKFTKAKERNGN